MAWTQNLLGLCFSRMRSRRSFLGLCLVAAVSQWLGHDFIVFRGSKSKTFSLFFIVFRGSKSNVSRFLRLYSCNGLDAKPAGALLFRMRSRRSFLGLCLVAWTQNLLGLCFFGCAPDAAFLCFAWWLQFHSGWGAISLFLKGPKATRFHCFLLFLGVPKATFRDF